MEGDGDGNAKINLVELSYVGPTILQNLFESKAEKMKNSKNLKIENPTKLKFYGLFKVATVGPINEDNKKPVGFFDFTTEKYKNQAWEKCSKLSKEEAMIEYIQLYNKLTGENDDEILNNFSRRNDDEDLDFESMDIPNDIETSQFVSTNAKFAKQEIDDYLLNVSENEKLFHTLKEKFYNGDVMTVSFLKDFADLNKFDCNIKILPPILVLNSKDNNGQTILHVAVDAINTSAVQSLIDLDIARQFINSEDNYKMTPMHIAAINFDYEIFNMLSSLNPDLTKKDLENKTAVEYLRDNEEIEEEIKHSLENINL